MVVEMQEYQLTQRLNQILDSYLDDFISGKRVTMDLMPEHYKELNKWFETDFTEKIQLDYYDNKLLIRSLEDNLTKWNKARNYQQTDELTTLIQASKKDGLSESAFKDLMDNYKKKWHETWLDTEIKTMRNSVENVNNWDSFTPDSRLMYSTAKDYKVRDEHAALDGLILPKTDPRWSYLAPPPNSNPWNCRCRLIAVHGNTISTDVTQRVEKMSKDMNKPVTEIKKGQNASFSGKIYSEDSSHFMGTPKKVYDIL